MAHYIDAECLKAEIDKRYTEYRAKMKTDDFTYYEGMADALDHFEQYIDSLQQEQPEVDLEREIRDYFSKWGYNIYNGAITMDNGIVVTLSSIQNVARHFYELGLNARKEGAK